MGTVRALARGDILKAEEIFLQPYATVFRWLWMDLDDAVFQENYAEVLRKKARRK